MRQAHPAAAIIFVAYYAIAVLVVVNLVTAWRAKFTVYRLPYIVQGAIFIETA